MMEPVMLVSWTVMRWCLRGGFGHMTHNGSWWIHCIGVCERPGERWKATDKGEVRALGDWLIVFGAADIEEYMG